MGGRANVCLVCFRPSSGAHTRLAAGEMHMHMSTRSRRAVRSLGVRATARLVALRRASEALDGGDDKVDAVLPHLLRHVAVLPSAAHSNRGCGEAGGGAAGESARLDQRILHLLSQHLERGGLDLGHGCRPVGRARGFSRERPVGSRRRFTRAWRCRAGWARSPPQRRFSDFGWAVCRQRSVSLETRK